MSQWGAWAAARDGRSFRDILAFYYPGTSLEPLSDPGLALKVRISSEPWKQVSTITQNFKQVDLHAVLTPATLVKHGPEGETSEDVPLGSFASAIPKDGKVEVVTGSGGRQGLFDWVEVRPGEGGRIKVQLKTGSDAAPLGPREYWGSMRVDPSSTAGYLALYNVVPIEQYLRSIAEVEYDWAMPSSASAYAPQAVSAQAVAARTYAVANKDPYLNDNQWDQVYLGYSGRSKPGETPFEQKYPGIPAAAEETAGLVLRYQGKVISSFFSAHSGGYTTAGWDGDSAPYLPAQFDPWSLEAPPTSLSSVGPGYPWTFTISAEELSGEVNGSLRDTAGRVVDVGLLSRVDVATRDTSDASSHARTLRLTGSNGEATVLASSFRALFGYSRMRSTLILEIVSPVPLPLGEFSDVGISHPYHDEISRVVLAGLMSGYAGETFRPENAVSRWQFAKIAVNLHNVLNPEDPIEVADASAPPFWDVPVKKGVLGDESDWVAAAKQAGLVNGVSGADFHPYEPVRRDQMASMLVRALGWEDEAAALPTETPGFGDLEPSSPHYQAATCLRSMGILLGYEDPLGSGHAVLRPEEPTKRKHVAVILCRVMDHSE